MIKQILALAGLALLSSGAALADEAAAQADRNNSQVAQSDASAPAVVIAAKNATQAAAGKDAAQELHPDARPVYNNNGHFGGQ